MAGNTSNCASPRVFLTEDIIKSILLRLPLGSCIARFRCVCRSWRILLSDPQFILKILCFPSNSHEDGLNQSSRQILITDGGDAATTYHLRRNHYSLLSYDTLCPISAGYLPAKRQSGTAFIVAGSCDGIFCIVDMNPMDGAPDVVLWNPATSETKLLPYSTGPPRRTLFPDHQITGFGFDPQTNDYKVARILCFMEEWDDCNDHGLDYLERLTTVTYAEVYSLKNDSWKRLNISDDLIPTLVGTINYVHPQRQRNYNSQNKSRCWFYASFGVCFTLSFDMSDEVFESTLLTLPPSLRDDKFMHSTGCFGLKDSLLTTFCDGDDNYSIWCLLKHGAADSWNRLYTVTSVLVFYMKFLLVWKEERFIFSRENITNDEAQDLKQVEETDGVYFFSPATGEYGDHIELQGRSPPFQAHIFTPTQVSLSDSE